MVTVRGAGATRVVGTIAATATLNAYSGERVVEMRGVAVDVEGAMLGVEVEVEMVVDEEVEVEVEVEG